MIMRVPAGRPHFNQSPNPRGTQELKFLIENLLITPQVKLTSDEANCKSGCNSKDKWTNGIMEYSIFNCTVILIVIVSGLSHNNNLPIYTHTRAWGRAVASTHATRVLMVMPLAQDTSQRKIILL